ncbi:MULTISPECIES: hypothetical protein [Alteribacter]|uniref:hypothetical protein n=1 Tax=Alteribacter TaxID=2823237 RepID=UPI001605D3A1|nr:MULTISPECIES: hypothetical protein [Alteribacter]MBM7094615.1 hypothetical protein [Alteribacter salitolerans]
MNGSHEEGRLLTTAEWYENEKENISLRSHARPHHFNTLSISFRQTKFPEECENQ